MTPFIDGHLDLALNAMALRRELLLPLHDVKAKEADVESGPFGTATVTLPELRRGGAVMVVSTLLARTRPWKVKPGLLGVPAGDFPDQDTAHAAAMAQLDYYRCLADRGAVRFVLNREDLPDPNAAAVSTDEPLPLMVTMEGADPVRNPDDLHRWHGAGLRTLMFSHFGKSTYAHGTPDFESAKPHPNDTDGPLTPEGRRLLQEVAALKMPLDLTHLSDTAMAETLDRFDGPVYASHCACRALNPDWQRNLPDDMIREIARRGGVIGLPLHSPFLVKGYQLPTPRDACGLDDVVDHLNHLREVTGGDTLVALGTDMDGGFGLEYTPTGIDGSGDLPRLAERMRERGWGDDAVGRVFAGNWLRFYRENLPAAT